MHTFHIISNGAIYSVFCVMKKKKWSVLRYKNKAVIYAKMISKQIAWRTCERCWCSERKKIQWSHVISVARSGLLSANYKNIIALCCWCHIYRRHKNPHEAVQRFDEKRPWRYQELVDLNVTKGSLWLAFWQSQYEENKSIYEALINNQCDF